MSGFSDTVMDHFLQPRCTGALPHATAEGWSGTLETSRYMRIQVHVEAAAETPRVVAATFATYGCAPAIAAGSWLCTWVAGRTVEEALTFTSTALTEALGGLPQSRRFCADLAVDALHAALEPVDGRG